MKKQTKIKITLGQKIFSHIEMMRPYTVIWCGLVSFAGACITIGDIPSYKISILSFFIPTMGWIAGLYLSDYLDKDLDLIQKTHRPIPSGRVSPNEALFVGGIYAIAGFILSFFLTINNIILVFCVGGLVFLYAKFSKSRGFLGNFNRGIVTALAYIFGIFSTGISLSNISFGVWLLSILFIIHDLNSNLVGAIRDMEGDKKGGYITFPVKYGIKKSFIVALILSIAYYIFLFTFVNIFSIIKYPIRFYGLISLAIIILFIMYMQMFQSLNKIDRKLALGAHKFFIIERITLASAIIIGIISYIYISISIYIISVLITIITQQMIRNKYEFKSII